MMKSDPDICVCNPVTENFTTFEILIQTSNPAFNLRKSTTRRRYNDFCWLRKILQKHHPLCTCPVLPEKKKFADRFEIQFLVQRMKELEDWLQSIVSISLYLSDTALHLFLQSTLTCRQIEQYLKGNISESRLEQAHKDAELHIDENTSSTSLEESLRDDSSSGAGESVCPAGASGGQTSPVQIRTRPPAVLHNNMQERSDSGIAGFESDVESSYDSEGSPYVSSLDSAVIPEKYPPLTEVCQVLTDKLSVQDTKENTVCASETKSESVNVSDSKQKAYLEADNSVEFKVETVINENMYDRDVQLNVTCKNIPQSKDIASEHTVSHGVNNQLIPDVSINAEVTKEEENVKSKQVTRKVEMGVLYC